MALDFAARIHALSGFDADATTDTDTGDDFDESAAQWLTDGAKEVINILSRNPDYLNLLTSSNTLSDTAGATLSLSNSKVINVVLYDGTRLQPCRMISANMRGRANDINDLMNYATTSDPVYWVKSGLLETFPTPTDSNYVYAETLSYPTFTAGGGGALDVESGTSIANFPDEAEYLVVLYAAIKAIEYMMLSEEDQEVYAPQLATLKQDYSQGVSLLGGGGQQPQGGK